MEKKRAFISVDKEAWDGTQRILKDLGISNHFYNEMLNDFIRGQYRVLSVLKEKKEAGEQITMGSFLRIMGGIVDELSGEQIPLIK